MDFFMVIFFLLKVGGLNGLNRLNFLFESFLINNGKYRTQDGRRMLMATFLFDLVGRFSSHLFHNPIESGLGVEARLIGDR